MAAASLKDAINRVEMLTKLIGNDAEFTNMVTNSLQQNSKNKATLTPQVLVGITYDALCVHVCAWGWVCGCGCGCGWVTVVLMNCEGGP